MFPLKQSTAIDWPFYAHDISGKPVTGMVNAGFTKRISKDGAAFGAMAVTITELENGWYSLPVSTSHTDTLGLLSMTFQNASCEQINLQVRIGHRLPEDSSLLFSGTSTGSSTVSKVFVQAGDPPTGAADDDYNDTLIAVWRGTSKVTAQVNVRAVTDYDDSDPSFTLDTALGFTPQANDLVEVYLADSAALAALSKLTTGFGSASPDTLNAYLKAIMSKTAPVPAGLGTYTPADDSLEKSSENLIDIQGAGFATGTDSLKQLRDAIDTLVAPAVVSSSALSGSGFLSDVVTLVRQMTDEPSASPKYTDADVVEYLHAGFEVILADLSINSDHPILVRFDISVVDGKQSYTLPPHCAQVWQVAKILAATNTPEWEVWPGSNFNFTGYGFSIEGNTLRLLRDWNDSETLQITMIPNGEVAIHKGTASTFTSTTVTLDTTPTDGSLDTRVNAYAGYMIRILSADQTVVEERIISAYDNTTNIATVSDAFVTSYTGTIVYEVLPQYSRLLKHIVALRTAIDLLSHETSAKKMQTLERNYQVKLSALRRLISSKNVRFPGHADGDTADNLNRGGGLLF